jgi:hypothetical protein
MPLRDHFRPPVDDLRPWEALHATWPVMIVAALRPRLPKRYYALPRVHSGMSAEIDVSTYEREENDSFEGGANGSGGGVAAAVWAPARPRLHVATSLPAQDLYEVEIYDRKRHSRLVAAVEIVSPGNKDRPEARSAFATKCAALLKDRVSVIIVDVVTTRSKSLYEELLTLIGHSDAEAAGPEGLYSVACRVTKSANEWAFETWPQPLEVGRPLPIMPLWLADNLAVPLELESTYEQSCSIIGVS